CRRRGSSIDQPSGSSQSEALSRGTADSTLRLGIEGGFAMLDTLRRSALFVIMAVVLLAATSPAPVDADGGGGGGGGGGDMSSGPPAKPEDPKYTEAVRAIKAKEYAKAVPLLQDVVSRAASNPEAHNWLRYATRKNGHPHHALPHYQ